MTILTLCLLSGCATASEEPEQSAEDQITEAEAKGSVELAALRNVKASVGRDENGKIIQLTLNAVYSDKITAETVGNVRCLTSLRSLSIYVPDLSPGVVDDVASLPSLEELHLQLVSLTANDLLKLNRLPLRTLGLNDVRIDESAGLALSEMTRLESLSIDSCEFPSGLDATFQPMPRIKSLKVFGGTKSQPSQLKFLESFPNLQCLWIVSIDVDESRLQQIGRLGDLEELSLQFTGLTDDGLRSLRTLTKLRRLILGNDDQFSGGGLRYLESSKELEELSVFATSFDDSAARLLSRFPKLNSFVAYDTPLSDASIDSLLQLRNVRLLWVSNTKISPRMIARLKQDLPKCEIK